MTDHMLVLQIQSAMETAGRYAFAPLPFLDPGSRCRLGGDGPSCWAIWIVVCRTAAQARWGTLPGGYIAGKGWRDRRYVGGKPIQLMRALVNDYSRPGDTVLDPFLGSGTTGHAAVELGRSFIGVEQDADAFAMAKQRIESARHKPGLSFTRTKKRKDRGLL
jgi:site-specific DNA-methyltransferase (adenine-specific)